MGPVTRAKYSTVEYPPPPAATSMFEFSNSPRPVFVSVAAM